MLGWSIRARACRSASNRAMTCRESIPALMSLTATSRLTGSVCWAIQTVPMPPSPICSSSLYGPMTAPGASATMLVRRHPELPGGRRFGRGFLQEAAGAFVEPQQVLHLLAQFRLPGAGLVQVGLALGRVFLLQCGDEDVALGHGSPASRGCCPSVRNPPADRANFLRIVPGLRLGVGAAQGAEQPGAGISPEEIGAAG